MFSSFCTRSIITRIHSSQKLNILSARALAASASYSRTTTTVPTPSIQPLPLPHTPLTTSKTLPEHPWLSHTLSEPDHQIDRFIRTVTPETWISPRHAQRALFAMPQKKRSHVLRNLNPQTVACLVTAIRFDFQFLMQDAEDILEIYQAVPEGYTVRPLIQCAAYAGGYLGDERVLENLLSSPSLSKTYATCVYQWFVEGSCDGGKVELGRKYFDQLVAVTITENFQGTGPVASAANFLINRYLRLKDKKSADAVMNLLSKHRVQHKLDTWKAYLIYHMREQQNVERDLLLEKMDREGATLSVGRMLDLVRESLTTADFESNTKFWISKIEAQVGPLERATVHAVLDEYISRGLMNSFKKELKCYKGNTEILTPEYVRMTMDRVANDGITAETLLTRAYAATKTMAPTSYDIAMRTAYKYRDAAEAEDVWLQAVDQGASPTPEMLSSLLMVKAKLRNNLEDAERIFDSFEEFGFHRQMRDYNTFMIACIQAKEYSRWRRKEHLLQASIEHQGLMPDVVTFNMMIKLQCKLGNSEELLKTLDQMKTMGVPPNAQTYCLLLRASNDPILSSKPVWNDTYAASAKIQPLLQSDELAATMVLRTLLQSIVRLEDSDALHDTWRTFTNVVKQHELPQAAETPADSSTIAPSTEEISANVETKGSPHDATKDRTSMFDATSTPPATEESLNPNATDGQQPSPTDSLVKFRPLVRPTVRDYEFFVQQLLKIGDFAGAVNVVLNDMKTADLRPTEKMISTLFQHAEYARRMEHEEPSVELAKAVTKLWPNISYLATSIRRRDAEKEHWTRRWQRAAEQEGGAI